MKTILEENDIKAIADSLFEKLALRLPVNKQEDTILDKKALAKYIQMPVSWIDKNLYRLPYFKMGKYVRFRKSEIDRFIDSERSKTRSPRRFALVMKAG